MALDGNGLYTTANKTCHSIVYQLGKINYPHHAKILQHNANFQLADALLLMYAKMCILHGSVSDTLCNLSPSEQLMYLPASGAVPDTIQVMEPPSLFIVFFKFFIPRCIVQESEVPLKKILLWNGASSWGSLKPGRGVFLKVTFCSVKHQVKYRLNLSPNYRPCYIPGEVPGVLVRAVLQQAGGRHRRPRHLQGPLHHANLQARTVNKP